MVPHKAENTAASYWGALVEQEVPKTGAASPIFNAAGQIKSLNGPFARGRVA